jgi:CheY-like chemotaxis protein
MDGYTATRRIKADPALRSIKIIAVTSYALSGEEKKAREAGCDDYVPKPFSTTATTGENPAISVLARHKLLQCMSPLLAQSGHADRAQRCPLSGVKRTLDTFTEMSALPL